MPRTNEIITSIVGGGGKSVGVTIDSVEYSGVTNGTITLSAAVPAATVIGDTIADSAGTPNVYLITGISGSDLAVQDFDTDESAPATGSGAITEAYGTWVDWEADHEDVAAGDMYSDGTDDNAVGQCYADADFDETIVIGTVAIGDVTLEPAAGQAHDGTPGTGVVNVNDDNTIVIDIVRGGATGKMTTVRSIEFDRNAIESVKEAVRSVADPVVIDANLMHGWAANRGGIPAAIEMVSPDGTVTNNIIYDMVQIGAGNIIGIQTSGGGATMVFANNTVSGISNTGGAGISIGIVVTDAIAYRYRNNLVQDCTSSAVKSLCYSISEVITAQSVSNNLSDDATAPISESGGAPILDATLTFADAASGDFHLDPDDSDARNHGMGPFGDSTIPSSDMVGRSRTGVMRCDVGALEFGSADGLIVHPGMTGGMNA